MHGDRGLAPPHGGKLVDLVVGDARAAELVAMADRWPSWVLSERQRCDLDLLACGAFSPLTGFLGRADHASVCQRMRLADGTLWPIPVTLDVDDRTRDAALVWGHVALRDDHGRLVAVLGVHEAWRADPRVEAEAVFGRCDPAHPSVDHLLYRTHPWYLAGRLEVLPSARTLDGAGPRFTPAGLRAHFDRLGITRVVAFNTRNPMHRAHQELTLRAARETGAHLLIHPVVGPTKPGDVDVATRVACYESLLPTYRSGQATLALLPLAMRMGGPREALWHAIIRQNFGATHMIVGRDHAGPGQDSLGRPFYDPYAAQELVRRHQDELAVSMVSFPQLGYVEDSDSYEPVDQVPPGTQVSVISGTEVRRRLARGQALPSWFTPPAVASVLRRRYPPLPERGVTVVLVGEPGAETTATAAELACRLQSLGRQVRRVGDDGSRPEQATQAPAPVADLAGLTARAVETTRAGDIALCTVHTADAPALERMRIEVEAWGGFFLVPVAPAGTAGRSGSPGSSGSARARVEALLGQLRAHGFLTSEEEQASA